LLKSSEKKACPYLGFERDAGTHAGYPSAGNFCFAVKTPRRIRSSRQQGFCLVEEHTRCKFFLEKITQDRS